MAKKLIESSNYIVSSFPNCVVFTPLLDGAKLVKINSLEAEVFLSIFNSDNPSENLKELSKNKEIDLESLEVFQNKLIGKLIDAGVVQFTP